MLKRYFFSFPLLGTRFAEEKGRRRKLRRKVLRRPVQEVVEIYNAPPPPAEIVSVNQGRAFVMETEEGSDDMPQVFEAEELGLVPNSIEEDEAAVSNIEEERSGRG